MARTEFEAGRIHRDTLSERFIPPAALTAPLPFVTFAEQVRSFLDGEVPSEAPGLAYLSRVGAKLDPIVQAKPTVTGPYPLVGFELLGVGPCGESFGDLIKQANLASVQVKFALAVVGMETARHLLNCARYASVKNFDHTCFTLNLDREMLLSPLMLRFVERYGDLLRQPYFLVEINEDLQADDVAEVQRLVNREELRVVLDDLNDWNQEVRDEFESLAVWTKVSHKAFQKWAERIDTDLAGTMQRLQRYALPNKPLVVEGVEREEHFRLLVNHWRGDDLYLQGHGVEPGAPWDKWLRPLREFNQEKKGGGYIVISGGLYAETMRILHTHLPGAVLQQMRCDHQQGWVACNIAQGEETLCLRLPTRDEREKSNNPFPDQPQAIQIVRELQAGDQSRQFTPEQLPAVLKAWQRKGELSDSALERAAERHEHYKGRFYIPSGFQEGEEASLAADQKAQEGKIESLDARVVLLQWLLEPNRPYCAVLGDYGMGKTFLCREFVREVHRLRREGRKELPATLYLDMRDYHIPAGTAPKLEEMLGDLLVRANMSDLPVDGVLAMAKAGHLCVIFDGFDEKSASMGAQDGDFLLKEMRRTVPAGSPGKVLISSRTHYFLDRQDEEVRIGGGVRRGTTRDGFQNQDFRLIYLLPFDEERIRAYLEKVFPGKGETILATFRGIHDLMELSTRPFLLQLIAGSLEGIQRRARPGVKVTAGDIYQEVMEAWLARDQEKVGILRYTILPAMESMARFLWSKEGQSCPHAQLFQWQMAHARSLFGADAVVDLDFHERLNTLLRTASFLTRDGEGNYRFAHTSFLEFFLARLLGRELAEGEGACLNLPPLSVEAMRFLIDLLTAGTATKAAATLVRVLTGDYQPLTSENAFHLALLWQQERPTTAPQPERWNLTGGELAGVRLAGCHLSNVLFDRACLVGADLTDARLAGSLRQANLSHLQAPGADLTGCDLTDCDLTAANLAGANLTESKLDAANLASTFLQRADLRGSTLAKARISRTRLAWSRLDRDGLAGVSPDRFSNVALPPNKGLAHFQPLLQSGHLDSVQAVAFSPDGTTLLSGSDDHTLKLWDARTGQCLHTLQEHQAAVRSVAFSPDGAMLLSGSFDRTLKLWDARTGQCLHTLQGHQAEITAVAFSEDGTMLLSGGRDNTLKLWDMHSGQCRHALQGHQHYVTAVAFSRDGATLLSGSSDNTLRLWDAHTGQCLLTLRGHQHHVTAVAFSPDGATLLSGSRDNTLKLWNMHSGLCLHTLQGHQDYVTSVAFSPDSVTLLSGSDDHTLKLWDAHSGRCLRTLQGHQHYVTSVAFSKDGVTLLSGSRDNTLKLWSARSGHCLHTLQGHQHHVAAVAFSPDGATLLSGGKDNTLKLWNARNGQCRHTLSGHQTQVTTVAFSPDGATLLSGSKDNILKLWNARSGQCLRTLQGHQDYVTAVAFSPDGTTLLSGSADRTLKLWDAYTGQCRHTLSGHQAPVTAVAFNEDGATLLSGSWDNTLKLWDARNSQCCHTLQGHKNFVTAVAFSPDGTTLLSGSRDNTLKLWDAHTGQCLRTLRGHQNTVTTVTFSKDGTTLLSGSADRTLKLWNARTGQCLRTLQGHQASVKSVAFSPDGKLIVSAGEALRLWDARTGQERVALWGWEDGGWVGMSPEGELLACNPAGLTRVGFVHAGCVYPGEEFAGCFPESLPAATMACD
ncbi:MAG: pentapeptide repeat-containing protein [Magnetococcales bacterium]|nr:pentapeptide repeat-containing protein [Magnetococcales bacterium]